MDHLRRDGLEVRRERDRNRLPARSAWARWTRRIAGLLATVAFLGVAVAIFQMIRPESGAAVNASRGHGHADGREASKKKSSKKKSTKPKALTKAQKAARAEAVDAVREQGYTTLQAGRLRPAGARCAC